MIELGDLFNRCLPIDMLLRMPRKFVNRLREIRKLQKKQEHQRQEQQLAAANNTGISNPIAHARQTFDSTAIDEMVDELS